MYKLTKTSLHFLDSIDQHIIDTEVNITHGNQHLTKASTYQVDFSLQKFHFHFA